MVVGKEEVRSRGKGKKNRAAGVCEKGEGGNFIKKKKRLLGTWKETNAWRGGGGGPSYAMKRKEGKIPKSDKRGKEKDLFYTRKKKGGGAI